MVQCSIRIMISTVKRSIGISSSSSSSSSSISSRKDMSL